MSPATVAIVDYEAGNLASVARALEHLGEKPLITRSPEEISRAERVVFPGVGAAGAAMESLRRLGLDAALRDFLDTGRPLIGICIGCQVIFDESDEDDGTACLGFLPGRVQLFRFPPESEQKVPHMGWNAVDLERAHPLTEGLDSGAHFYFVHSYYPVPADDDVVVGRTSYDDVRFAAIVHRENLAAVQFHAEKSGPAGLKLLSNFLRWTP